MKDIKFSNRWYVTAGVNENVSAPLQLFLWKCISDMAIEKDYLQIFVCGEHRGKQTIEHIQEQPEYSQKYLLSADTIFMGKIFVIDDGTHSTMLLAEEY